MKVVLSKNQKGIFKCEIPSLKISKTGKDINRLYEDTVSYANEIEKSGIKRNEKLDSSKTYQNEKSDFRLIYFINHFYGKVIISFILIILILNFMVNKISNSLQFEIKTGSDFWEPLEKEFHDFADNIDNNFEIEKREKFLNSLIKIKKAYKPFFDELGK